MADILYKFSLEMDRQAGKQRVERVCELESKELQRLKPDSLAEADVVAEATTHKDFGVATQTRTAPFASGEYILVPRKSAAPICARRGLPRPARSANLLYLARQWAYDAQPEAESEAPCKRP
jgi:hypothetical protein